MKRLPHWCITDKFPALYDTESATAIEMTAKLYGAISDLIDDYNAWVDKVNKHIEDYENGLIKDYEVFKVAMRQEFQDFINTVDLKMRNQDAVIADAVSYMKTNLRVSIKELIAGLRVTGELNADILNALDDFTEKLDDEATARQNADNDLQTAIENEATARTNADNDLQTAIDNEAQARTNADNDLQTAIENEATARENAIKQAIASEAKSREEADEELRELVNGSKVFVTPQMFGAKADGKTDDLTAIQNAIDYASENGYTFYLPNGNYYISDKIVIDNTNGKKIDFIGAGVWNTTITVGGAIGIEITGVYNSDDESSYITKQIVKGFLVQPSADNTNDVKGINIFNLSCIKLEDIYVAGCNYGIFVNGIDHSIFENVTLQWNDTGLYMTNSDFVNYTNPNNIDLFHCRFASNKVAGAYINFPTTFNMHGGSVEHNGTNAGTTYNEANCGIAIINGGLQGGVACNIHGVYFESNAGIGDLYLINNNNYVVNTSDVYNVIGCTFQRAVNTHYTYGNITCKFVSATAYTQKLNVVGCSFKGYNLYEASAERKSIMFTSDAMTNDNCNVVSCLFELAEEKPIIYLPSTKYAVFTCADTELTATTAKTAKFNLSNVNGLNIDASAGSFVIPESGLYDVGCMLVTNSGGGVEIRLKLNGIYYASCYGNGITSISQNFYLEKGVTVTFELYAVANCTIQSCIATLKQELKPI